MKFVIVFVVACIATAMAAPAPAPQQDVQILRYDSDVEPEGYKYFVETSDGTIREEEGTLKNPGTEQEAISVRGSFSYVGDDGQTYTVNYIADENGFQPEGAHLPRA